MASQSTFSGGFSRLYAHPFFDRFRSRRRRRTLGLLFLASALGFPLITWATGLYYPGLVMIVPLTVFGLALDASIHGISDLPPEDLDEHQRALRFEAFNDAYWPAVLLALFAGLSIGGLRDAEWPMSAAVLSALVAVLLEIPGLILAWRLPDEAVDEA